MIESSGKNPPQRVFSLIDPTKKTVCLTQELQQSKCRNILCSNQELLKRAHPTECYITKRKDGECHMKANFHTPNPKTKLYTMLLCSNPDLPKLAHSPQGMLLLIHPTGCCAMKRKDGKCPDRQVVLSRRVPTIPWKAS